jgi:hypothetical protein
MEGDNREGRKRNGTNELAQSLDSVSNRRPSNRLQG